jgi:hypothetical protein
MKTMSVGMGLETRVHCLNRVICQTRVVIIIMVTFRVFVILIWFKLNVGSCFRLLWSFRFIPIFLLPLFYSCLVAW